jgi:phosphoribosylaminoimidazole synthetase
VLVASTDGVGTKLKIAAYVGHFESVGQDLVSLNVNDILTKGARPLFFLDYISFSALDEQRMETLMRGIIWGCHEVGCALIGGETAQMPDLYAPEDFDLAGFVVGVMERDDLLDGSKIQPGDCLIGIPSRGTARPGGPWSTVRGLLGGLNHFRAPPRGSCRGRCSTPVVDPRRCTIRSMDDIQRMIEELMGRGWTIAAISDELGVSRDTVSRWRSGTHPPQSPRLVILGMERLLRRRRIPKRKRYKRNPPAT